MKVKFPVGDWSNDGHGKCDYFIVKTAKGITLEHIDEAHAKAKEVLGFSIGSICEEYEDHYLTKQHVLKLKELGYAGLEYGEEPFKYDKSDWYMEPEDVVEIWIFFLNHINPSLGLKLIDNKIPSFIRSDLPGYGCFY